MNHFDLGPRHMLDERRLPQKDIQVNVLSGQAWITFEGWDYFVEAGGTIQLSRGRHPAIVSSANHDCVTLTVEIL